MLLIGGGLSLTSVGTEFFIAFSDIGDVTSTTGTSGPQIFIVTNSTATIQVTFSAPRYLSYPNPKSIPVSSISPYQWNYFDRKILMSGTESSTKGIYISATGLISVYALNYARKATGGYMALPSQSLGSDYIATTYYENIVGAVGSQIGKNCIMID